jgi:tRNA (cmo5U34)-methyltransferase
VRWPVLQSSANRAGGPDPRRLEDVPELLRAAADLVIDGGELPGTPSTVIDLRRYEETGEWSVVRAGAVAEDAVARILGGQFHFDPSTYLTMMHEEVPAYERLQDELVAASTGGAPRRILELGTGTGETARRLLDRHPDASLVGIDASDEMLACARAALPASRVELFTGRLEDPFVGEGFDLVASALAVHHLDGPAKADLFRRVAAALVPGGRFVLGDVVVPADPADARTPLTEGFDRPSTVGDQLAWLKEAGFTARVTWEDGDLAVIAAELVG